MMGIMRLIGLVAASVLVSAAALSQSPDPWQQPAAALAEQIAGFLGPGQSQLTLRNLSTIPADQVPVIRALLEQDLKAHGVQASGEESANSIRVTLSENLRERLWVAEVVQGNETRVAMVRVEAGAPQPVMVSSGMTLRAQRVLQSNAPVLALLESRGWLMAVAPAAIVLYRNTGGQWLEQQLVSIGARRMLGRDPRALVVQNASGDTLQIFVPGTACSGNIAPENSGASPSAVPEWSIHCNSSDDPWPIAQMPAANGAPQGAAAIKAFYNAARNYFTGVVTPSVGVDLPPFYSAAALPRPAGAALLIGGIDGKIQILENGALKTVNGARDWGSDFAVLHSECGAGDQVIVSGSGEAVNDSLRAYELPGLEAVPASAPLAMDGTVTALWSAPDGKSLMAVLRHVSGDYEVDRVTALCN